MIKPIDDASTAEQPTRPLQGLSDEPAPDATATAVLPDIDTSTTAETLPLESAQPPAAAPAPTAAPAATQATTPLPPVPDTAQILGSGAPAYAAATAPAVSAAPAASPGPASPALPTTPAALAGTGPATPPPGYPGAQVPAHSGSGIAQPGSARPPLRLALTILHLAAYGLVGFVTISLLAGAFAAGVGLLFALGFGIVLLVGLVYALFGIAWFENARVSGLYRLDSPPLELRRGSGEGFKAWLHSVALQSVDGRMWRSLANFAVASVFGACVLGLFQWFAHMFGNVVFQRGGVALIFDFFAALLSVAGIVGLALLYRLIAIAIARAGVNEQRLAAQATASAKQATVSAQQREGAVRAADVERTRIERDLHDGVQPRLVSVGMTLGLAQQKIDTDPEAAKQLVAEAHTSTKAAITELRQLARGIYASVLDDRGLDAALSAVAARSHIPVQLDVRLDRRCSRDVEAAVYFAIAESLTNAAKHSRASEARVVVRLREDAAQTVLWARVEDNGIGGARVVPGGGLDGVMNRVLAAGGTSTLDSPQGGPTSLEVSVPCAS